MRIFDVVVIGAGPAGEVVAGRLAEHGLKVAIVEDRLVGGECSFWACMPSKALLRPYEALAEVRRIPGAAEAVTGKLDVAAALARRDEVIHDLSDDGQLPWLEDRGIELIRGHGRLTGERRVQVGDEEIDGAARGLPGHGVAAVDAADRRPGRDRRRVVEPRGDDREGDPGAARDHRRRRGRRGDGAGLPDARQPGDAGRGRAATAPARGGVRLLAGHAGARGLRRRDLLRAEGREGRAGGRRDRHRLDVEGQVRRGRRAARRAGSQAVDR